MAKKTTTPSANPIPMPQPKRPLQPAGVKPLAPGGYEVAGTLPKPQRPEPWIRNPPLDWPYPVTCKLPLEGQ